MDIFGREIPLTSKKNSTKDNLTKHHILELFDE